MMDFTNLSVVLGWLATGVGGAYLMGKLVSYLAENWTKWHELPTQVKFIVPMVVSVLISLGATLLLEQVDLVAQISPWFTLISVSVVAYLGTQKGYMETKVAGYGKNADPKK